MDLFIYPAFVTTAEGVGAVSWNDLLELQKEGIDIECHSMTHPILTKKGGKSPEKYAAWLENETGGAKKILEEHMGKPITCLAYPYGEWNKQVQATAHCRRLRRDLHRGGQPGLRLDEHQKHRPLHHHA